MNQQSLMPRYTLKKDGLYLTGHGFEYKFFARSVAGSYTFDAERIVELQKHFGGTIIEVIKGQKIFDFIEREVQL